MANKETDDLFSIFQDKYDLSNCQTKFQTKLNSSKVSSLSDKETHVPEQGNKEVNTADMDLTYPSGNDDPECGVIKKDKNLNPIEMTNVYSMIWGKVQQAKLAISDPSIFQIALDISKDDPNCMQIFDSITNEEQKQKPSSVSTSKRIVDDQNDKHFRPETHVRPETRVGPDTLASQIADLEKMLPFQRNKTSKKKRSNFDTPKPKRFKANATLPGVVSADASQSELNAATPTIPTIHNSLIQDSSKSMDNCHPHQIIDISMFEQPEWQLTTQQQDQQQLQHHHQQQQQRKYPQDYQHQPEDQLQQEHREEQQQQQQQGHHQQNQQLHKQQQQQKSEHQLLQKPQQQEKQQQRSDHQMQQEAQQQHEMQQQPQLGDQIAQISCLLCSNIYFSSLYDYQRHMALSHFKDEIISRYLEQPKSENSSTYLCVFCHMSFGSSSFLVIHLATVHNCCQQFANQELNTQLNDLTVGPLAIQMIDID